VYNLFVPVAKYAIFFWIFYEIMYEKGDLRLALCVCIGLNADNDLHGLQVDPHRQKEFFKAENCLNKD